MTDAVWIAVFGVASAAIGALAALLTRFFDRPKVVADAKKTLGEANLLRVQAEILIGDKWREIAASFEKDLCLVKEQLASLLEEHDHCKGELHDVKARLKALEPDKAVDPMERHLTDSGSFVRDPFGALRERPK